MPESSERVSVCDIAAKFAEWASSPKGRQRIREDAKKANVCVETFRRMRNVPPEVWDRRITI